MPTMLEIWDMAMPAMRALLERRIGLACQNLIAERFTRHQTSRLKGFKNVPTSTKPLTRQCLRGQSTSIPARCHLLSGAAALLEKSMVIAQRGFCSL